MNNDQPVFESWAVVELLGHQRTGAYVREATLAGAGLLRLDIPLPGEDALRTQYISPAALYRLSPCNEETARAVAAHNQPTVIHPWELPRSAPDAPRALVAHQDPYDDDVCDRHFDAEDGDYDEVGL